MSHSMMHTSMLIQEELRIFEELISRFDSLSEAQMSTVGVTPGFAGAFGLPGSEPRLKRFVNLKREGGQRKSVRAARSNASTGSWFQRIGPRRDIFFARN
jgi:hypothetical protein